MADLAKIFVVLIFTISFCQAIKLSAYMKPCKMSDPNVQACLLKSTREAVPSIIRGDKRFRIKPLDPYEVKELSMKTGSFQLNFTDLVATGVKNIEVKTFNIDFDTNTWKFDAFIPSLTLLATYDIGGSVLFLPIMGHGPSNVTFTDINVQYILENEIISKSNEKYLNITHATLTCQVSRMYTTFNNLFNGNGLLAEEMHKLVNENWQEVYKDVAPVLNGTLNTIATNSFRNVFKLVPLKDMFLQ